MDYERIHKHQSGIISPSKLRAKLMGLSPQKIKQGSNSNSKSNSSTTSPSKHQDSELVNNSLLASNHDDDFFDSAVSLELLQKPCGQTVSSSLQMQNHHTAKEISIRGDRGNNSTAVHPLRFNDDENLDYDSNASSSSFEFHKGERGAHRSLTRSLSRPTSYKWNDAEKWIMSKQASQVIHDPKSLGAGGARMTSLNMVRVVPEGAASYDYQAHPRMPEMKRVDFCLPTTGQLSSDKLTPAQSNGSTVTVDLHPQSEDLREVDNLINAPVEDPDLGTPAIRAICMRDMGTEMTPIASQEPSRTATPDGSSTPQTTEPMTTPVELIDDNNARHVPGKGDKELSEQEMKLKTRREIVALGVQLGKMNIAAWASKDDKNNSSLPADPAELERVEFEKRAAAWEEAENTKHAARYRREEIRIQAWESHQKAKLEEELRRIEGDIEQLRMNSRAKMMKKIAEAKKKSEQKRVAIEAQKKRLAEKTAAQAEYIRQTGRNPPSDYICCGLLG